MLVYRICRVCLVNPPFFFCYIDDIMIFILFISLFLCMFILGLILFKILWNLFIHTEIPRPHLSITLVLIRKNCLKLMEFGQVTLPWTVTLYHMEYIHGYICSLRIINCDGEANHTFGTIFCYLYASDAVICTSLWTWC